MDNKWNMLSPEEKREQRFNWWLNPQEANFRNLETEKAYKLRVQRFIDVYRVQEPDRVPVVLPISTVPAYLHGIDTYTAMYDYDKAVEAWDEFNMQYAQELDSFTIPVILPGRVYDILDYKLYRWPGRGLPKNAIGHQYIEGEYMLADEYDAFIRDPSDFLMRIYMPRVFGLFEPYKLLTPLINIMELPDMYFIPYINPDLQASLQMLINVGKELSSWVVAIEKLNKKGLEQGFPIMGIGALVKAPFDTLGDTLRGTHGLMTDIYRQPDRVLEAMDVIAELNINSAITSLDKNKGFMATFPLHKGADGWMSRKQFEVFYWPPLKKIIDALINEGILVSLFAEGSYNTRLETVNEFPEGAVHWMFDRTDMAKAKEILGRKCSIQGNVPVSLLAIGTPGEVKEHCRKLIEVCGKGGGYILSAGASVDEAKLENIRAMVEASREFGAYKE